MPIVSLAGKTNQELEIIRTETNAEIALKIISIPPAGLARDNLYFDVLKLRGQIRAINGVLG
jgi:hypothetical protein